MTDALVALRELVASMTTEPARTALRRRLILAEDAAMAAMGGAGGDAALSPRVTLSEPPPDRRTPHIAPVDPEAGWRLARSIPTSFR